MEGIQRNCNKTLEKLKRRINTLERMEGIQRNCNKIIENKCGIIKFNKPLKRTKWRNKEVNNY